MVNATDKKKPVVRKAPVKKVATESVSETVTELVSASKQGMIHTIGRRKEAVAQVRFTAEGTGKCVINGREYKKYFTTDILQGIVEGPQKVIGAQKADISVLVKGGGVHGQAEAVRLGIARALLELSENNRVTLRANGFLTRDARVKERKKYGLHSARRAPQFSKR